MNARPQDDNDPNETQEWIDALTAAVAAGGKERGLYLLKQLEEQAQHLGIVAHVPPYSAYQNTIPLEQQGAVSGRSRARGAHHRRSCAGMRWRWWCAPTRPMASSAATSRATRRPPRSSRSASITSSVAPKPGRRRPRLLPAALGARRVCTRVPRRRLVGGAARELPAGGRRRRAVVVSASLAHAGVLAVSHGLDGPRPDQRDLPGALHALPRASRPREPRASGTCGACSATARWTSPNRSAR